MGMSLQEILVATTQGRREVEAHMDKSHPSFHPEDASIYSGLKEAKQREIHEILNKVSLRELCEKLKITEFLGHSGALTTGSTGASGANYLSPDKIYATIFENARCEDITPLVSNIVDTPGATLKIDAEIDGQYAPTFVGSGGEAPFETMETAQGTITPRLFSINIGITHEMIEDSLFDLMEMHVRVAGKGMGEFSTKMCLFPIMEDHRGTTTTFRVEGAYNGISSGGAYTYVSDILESDGANATDGFTSDVVIFPPHGLQTFLIGEGAGTPWASSEVIKFDLKAMPFGTALGMDLIRLRHITTADVSTATSYTAGLYATHWHALVLNKTYGIQTVRKRWLKIENYSDPIKDLQGAVVSARQGHLVAYADACCVLGMA